MRQIGAIFRGFLLSSVRDKYTLFWDLAFPIILLVILVSIFGNLGETLEEVVFDVGLVVEPAREFEMIPVGEIVQGALEEMEASTPAWLTLFREQSLAEALTALERGERHAIVHVQGSDVAVHMRPGRMMSEIAGDMLVQVLGAVNLEVNRRLGLISGPTVQLTHGEVEAASGGEGSFSYAAYMVPGIILMVFLSSGLGPMVQRLAVDRELGRLRRLFASPLGRGQYFVGLLLYVFVLSVVQVCLIYAVGALFFGVKLPLLTWDALFFMVLAWVTLLSVGIAISALTKTANAAAAVANGLMYPMMFLGGLYFPVTQLSYPLKLAVLVNPVTYLVNGLRHSLGVLISPTSPWANVGVPLLFTAFALIVGLTQFKWDV